MYKVPSYAVAGDPAKRSSVGALSVIELQSQKSALLVGSPEFRSMCREFRPNMSENVGYMMMVLDKEQYLPGQTVEGRLYFDLFIPCFQNKLMLKLEGNEIFPSKHIEHVFEDVL
jgi:hypothetical protein